MRSTSFHFAMRSDRAKRPDLQLSGAPADREMSDRDVLGLAGSRGDDRAEAARSRPRRRPSSPCQRAGLVGLDQRRVGGFRPGRLGAPDPALVTRKSSPTICTRSPTAAMKPPEADRVVLGERVLDRDDRIAGAPAEQELGQAVAVELALLQAEPVASAASELRGGDVERDGDVLARFEAGALDRRHQRVQRLLVAGEGGPPAAFVGDALQESALAMIRPAAR